MMQVEVVSREDYFSFIEKQPLGNFITVPFLGWRRSQNRKTIFLVSLTQIGNDGYVLGLIPQKLTGLKQAFGIYSPGPGY